MGCTGVQGGEPSQPQQKVGRDWHGQRPVITGVTVAIVLAALVPLLPALLSVPVVAAAPGLSALLHGCWVLLLYPSLTVTTSVLANATAAAVCIRLALMLDAACTQLHEEPPAPAQPDNSALACRHVAYRRADTRMVLHWIASDPLLSMHSRQSMLLSSAAASNRSRGNLVVTSTSAVTSPRSTNGSHPASPRLPRPPGVRTGRSSSEAAQPRVATHSLISASRPGARPPCSHAGGDQRQQLQHQLLPLQRCAAHEEQPQQVPQGQLQQEQLHQQSSPAAHLCATLQGAPSEPPAAAAVAAAPRLHQPAQPAATPALSAARPAHSTAQPACEQVESTPGAAEAAPTAPTALNGMHRAPASRPGSICCVPAGGITSLEGAPASRLLQPSLSYSLASSASSDMADLRPTLSLEVQEPQLSLQLPSPQGLPQTPSCSDLATAGTGGPQAALAEDMDELDSPRTPLMRRPIRARSSFLTPQPVKSPAAARGEEPGPPPNTPWGYVPAHLPVYSLVVQLSGAAWRSPCPSPGVSPGAWGGSPHMTGREAGGRAARVTRPVAVTSAGACVLVSIARPHCPHSAPHK